MIHRITVLLLLGLGLSVPAHAANLAPTISGTPASWVYVGSPYSFKPTGRDPEGAKLTYQIFNKPAWATFSTSTGVLSGTPQTVGLWNGIRIRASDGVNTSPAIWFSIRATSRDNVPPTISGAPATSVAPGAAYSFTPSASDANGDPLRFSISHKPAWASFDPATGKLSGTPSASNVGTYSNIVIAVTDGNPYVSLAPFSITVSSTSNRAPTISGTPPTSVNAGSAYAFRPTAADANGDKLTFSIANKPAWATFSTSTGQLSGTPMSASAGTYANVAISVSDGKASTALAPFAITVADTSNGAASLTWMPPTQNTDGTALTNLAGYRIVYGASASQLTQTIQLTNAGLSNVRRRESRAGHLLLCDSRIHVERRRERRLQRRREGRAVDEVM
jgi:hypothetical protein